MNLSNSPIISELYNLIQNSEPEVVSQKIIEAVKERPENIGLIFQLGIECAEHGRVQDALNVFQGLMACRILDARIPYNLGYLYTTQGMYQSALKAFEAALQIAPNDLDTLINKASALHELKHYEKAILAFNDALKLNPFCAQAWVNKANTLYELKDFDEALRHYQKGLQLQPEIDWAYGKLLHIKRKIGSFDSFEEDLINLSKKIKAKQKIIDPFSLLALTDDPALNLQCAQIYSQNKYQINRPLAPLSGHQKHDKIRIAYFSADFRNHPVACLTAEVYENHDREKFEVFAFSFGPDDHSPIRQRLMGAFDHFLDVKDQSDLEIAKLARELEIDIAIDLGGYTADNRAEIFSHRAAPVQTSYIGFLGTMGSSCIDYLIADQIIIPESHKPFYTEKIAYLPSYQANDSKRLSSFNQITRAELGLPEIGMVFCCFNNTYKILPATFDMWMNILRATPKSVLFLYAENPWVEGNFKKEALVRGIDSNRLIFGGHLPLDKYLARYEVCDLFLDTAPYNAGTTASDALWVNLPVITLIGQSFASRVAASLLNAIGAPELIAQTPEDYEALAIRLGNHPHELSAIRKKLALNRSMSPLFNTPIFTKNLEAAYIKMYERSQQGFSAEDILIS